MARQRELYRLATSDDDLLRSPDCEPVAEWLSESGIGVSDQWRFGFGLSSLANAWDGSRHPHVAATQVDELASTIGLAERKDAAIALLAADRGEFRRAFAELGAAGPRTIWELRPFKTRPFLRLEGDTGLLLLARPWMLSWLGEGLHYRALQAAQTADKTAADRRTDHVQRYTAYAGQVFERYSLDLAQAAIHEPARVFGEQPYGRKGGKKTSDIAVVIGDNLILFEANARRVGAEPLVTGDPLSAATELTRLVVKKIDQLGVVVGAFLAGDAQLPDVNVADVKRIWPVVLAAGHVWQTKTLWDYLHQARNADKCAPLDDERVGALQLLDAGDFEKLLALAAAGHDLANLLAAKASGPYRHRDFAVWLSEDAGAPDPAARLPAIAARFNEMAAELTNLFPRPDQD